MPAVVEEIPQSIQLEEKQSRSGGGKVSRGIIATVLLLIASGLIYVSGTTYFAGIQALGFTHIDGKISKVTVKVNPFFREQFALVNFTVNNETVSATAPIPRDRIMKTGETVDVYFDKSSPSHISLTREVDYDTVIITGSIGFFALSFGSFMAYRQRQN